MPFNGSGSFNLVAGNPVSTGTIIESAWANDTLGDMVANGLSLVLPTDGQSAMTGQLKLTNGTAAIPAVTFSQSTSTGVYRPGTGLMANTVNGVEVIRFKQNGAVMIGTTTDDGTNKLQVTGGTKFTGAVEVTGTTTLAGLVLAGALSGVTNLTTTGNTILGNAVGDTLNVANGSIVVNASGNTALGGQLGVTGATSLAAMSATTGTFSSTLGVTGATTLTTASISSTLGVTGTATLAGNVNISGLITSSSAEALRQNHNTGFISAYNTAGSTRTGYIQWNTANQVIFATENGAYPIWTVGGSERLRLTTNGDLGLGGTPANYGAGTVSLALNASSTPVLDLLISGTRYGAMIATTGEVRVSAIPAVPLTFYTTNTERMRIAANGNVGLGGSPSATLHLVGTTGGEIRIQTNGGFLSGYNNAGSTRNGYINFTDTYCSVASDTAIPFLFYTNGAERARIVSTGELLVARTSSAASVYKLQVGDGSAEARSVFQPNSAFAVGLSNGAGNGNFYLGATAAASPTLIFSNNAGTQLATITGPGVFNLDAGSGNFRLGGSITRFESAEQTCPTGTTNISVAHGGPRKPDIVYVVLRCKTTEGGWAVGDEISMAMDDANRQAQMYGNATNAGVLYVAAGLTPAIRNTSGTQIAVTAANWRVVLYCHWL